MEIDFPKVSEELSKEVELGDVLYHADIPKYFSENFPTVKTQEDLLGLRRQYLRGHFKNELEIAFSFAPSGVVRFVAKPTGFSIKPIVKGGRATSLLKIAYPNGCKVQTENLKSFGLSEDEVGENMKTIHVVDCKQTVGKSEKYGEFIYHEGNIQPVTKKVDLDNAKKIIDEVGIYRSLFYALHMGVCKDTINLMLPRFLTFFTFPLGLENNRPCVAQFTCPSTGKSTFIFKKTALINAHYINEVPRLPALVGNCATGYYGYAKIFSCLDFDEFEKYKAGEWNSVSQCFLTGMYNAVWKRDQSTKDGEIIQYRNEVSVNFHGNADMFAKTNPREALKSFLDERKDPSPSAFDERLTMVSIVKKCEPMQKMVFDSKTIKHPVFRGLIRSIQNEIDTMKYEKNGELSGRLEENWNKIYLFMSAMFSKELSKDDLKLCSKELLLDGVSNTLLEIITGSKDKEIVHTETVTEEKEKVHNKKETVKEEKVTEEQVELNVEVEMVVDEEPEYEEIDEVTDTSEYLDKEKIREKKRQISPETLKKAEELKLKKKYSSGKLM